MAGIPKLTAAEKTLIACAAKGKSADFRARNKKTNHIRPKDPKNDPAKGGKWAKTRIIRAAILRRLLVDPPKKWSVHAKGVRITGARITGELDLEETKIKFPLFLTFCHVEQPITLRGAETKTLAFTGSHIPSIDGPQIKTTGSVILDDVSSTKGGVTLASAKIGGQLVCKNATFENDKPEGYALNAQDVTVKGDVFLRNGFSAKGGVWLAGADIGGQLDCADATFENDKLEGYALNAQGVIVKEGVLLRNGFSAKGGVWLAGADIGGTLDCDDATFANENLLEFAFVLQNARVKGIFFWRPAEETTGNISFQHARTGPLMDNKAGWPKYGSLLLDGFEYSAFAPGAPQTAEERLDWLGRQPKIPKEFTPQPYEHLIKVFRQMGHTRDARDVGIAKHDDFRSNRCCANLGEWLWNGILSVTIAHGYKPWKALIWMLAIVFAGWLVFANAETRKAIHPSKERVLLDDRYFNSGGRWRPLDYPAFSAAWYSLDVFLPIVDLHQESYWLPGKTDGPVLWAWRYKIWLWVEILLGWFLTTIAVAGLTGLVKKD